MTINVITAANSRTTQLYDAGGNAFLLVKSDGYIVTVSELVSYYTAAAGTTATIEGSVISTFGTGIYTGGGQARITVGTSGIVGGGQTGLRLFGGDNTVTNAGLIYGNSDFQTVEESAGVYFSGIANELKNTGSISGYYAIANDDGGDLTVTNSGTLTTDATYAVFASGNLSLTNNEDIEGSVSAAANLLLTNTGTITGDIYSTQSSQYAGIFNYGTTTGVILTGSGSDYLLNAGTVRYVGLYEGSDSVVNSGTILNGVDLGYDGGTVPDEDIFTNTGTVFGAVSAGDGDDLIDSSEGRITGAVDLGDGNDSYVGGDGRDRVVGGAGADAVNLGNGDDVFRAGNADGKDEVDAGDGQDTYDASAATLGFTIDLSASTTGGTVGNDIALNFENIVGGQAADTITGSDDANRILGGAGGDKISGGDGADRLIGGAGADTITGGAGRDVMTGGATGAANESDKFVFADGDTGPRAGGRDVITDFTDHGSASAPFATGADLIDLKLIDAKANVAGDQAFSFNATGGAAFSGVAGSLIWVQSSTFATISGDTDGDGKADFTIQLNGVHNLLASDFVL